MNYSVQLTLSKIFGLSLPVQYKNLLNHVLKYAATTRALVKNRSYRLYYTIGLLTMYQLLMKPANPSDKE